MRCDYSYTLVLLLGAAIAQVFCNDPATEIHDREKRQSFRDYDRRRGRPHQPSEDPERDFNGYEEPEGPDPENPRFSQPQPSASNSLYGGGMNAMPAIGNRIGGTQGLGLGLSLNIGAGNGAQNAANMALQAANNAAAAADFRGMAGGGGMGNLGGIIPNIGLGSIFSVGGQRDPPQNGPLDNGPIRETQGGDFANPQPHPGNRQPPGHQGRPGNNPPGHQGNRPSGPPGHQPERPGQQPGRPGQQPERPGQQPGRPGQQPERPGQQPGRPGQQPGRPSEQQPGRPDQQVGRPGERPGQQNGRPVEEEVYSNVRPVVTTYQGGERPGDVSNEYGSGQSAGYQGQGGSNGRPGGGSSGYNSGQSGSGGRPGGGSNGQNHGNGNGNNAQQLNLPNQGGGGGGKKCRGNQYTCQNRECVPRNARCNGVEECQDGSDELNCYTSGTNHGGQGSSTDTYTTAAPFGGLTTTASPTTGCILPEQPAGGRYELGSCEQPCDMPPGSRVPLTSYLTYTCDEGYTLSGHNTTFCHGGTWYLPPTCVKTCSPLKSNSVDIECKLHGEKVLCGGAIAPGTKATLKCKNSFKIPLTEDPAYRELTCLEDGIWDRTLFRCLPECGTAVAHGNTLIVNGFTAKLGVFPWHVGVYEKNSLGFYDQICAGTLVSPGLVISAAHCFYDDTTNEVQGASKYAVAAGKHYRLYNMQEKYAQKSAVKRIDVASRYFGASGNFAEDISLVRLETPFTLSTLVRPVCMDWDNTYERDQLQSGQTGKAVGWGKTVEGVPSTELQEINLPYIPYQECVSAVPEEFKGYVTADKFCAGYLNGSSLCEGDSGGGLCFQLNGLWYLRGIVSVSPVSENTCDNNYYTAFTNVGRFREWIRAAYISED